MLGKRRGRLTDIEPTLGEAIVLARKSFLIRFSNCLNSCYTERNVCLNIKIYKCMVPN